MNPVCRAAAYGTASFMLLSAGYVLGQQSAPADYKLVSEDVLASIDLATEIDSVQDRDLRLSRATIAPGGHVGLHQSSTRSDDCVSALRDADQSP